MLNLCFYFQVHQPFRLRHLRMRDVGEHPRYFDDALNREIFHKVANKCYWPAGRFFQSMVERYPGSFKCTFSMSGTFLQQCEEYAPDLMRLYQALIARPEVDLLCETSHHSLAALYDEEEFKSQVNNQRAHLWRLFGKSPRVFRNTELIYEDRIGSIVADLGFQGCLHEGWERVLPHGWNGDHLFHHPYRSELRLLPKNYRLSDDIAFRFSNRAWAEWPLTSDKYLSWLGRLNNGEHEFIGLFMDYETFGEHQWSDTGIFDFMEHMIGAACAHPHLQFVTATEAIERLPARTALSVQSPLSWADVERDVSAWLGNEIQNEAFERIYQLKPVVELAGSPEAWEEWRKLQTSDYFYYMCIKYSADGDVHKYFSHCESPYAAYLDYMKTIDDFEIKLNKYVAAKAAPLIKPPHFRKPRPSFFPPSANRGEHVHLH